MLIEERRKEKRWGKINGKERESGGKRTGKRKTEGDGLRRVEERWY